MVIDKNDILWLSFDDFRNHGYSEKDLSYLKRACYGYRKGELSSYINIEDPEKRSRILVQYNSIPKRDNFPSETQLREQYRILQLKQAVQNHCGLYTDKALNHFKANPNTHAYAQELAEQSAWLLFLASCKNTSARKMNFISLEDLYTKAIDMMQRTEWTRWRCTSLQVLRRKLKPFLTLYKKPLNGTFTDADFIAAINTLVHKGVGNKNSEKLSDSQRAVIFQRYADGDAKPTIEQVYTSYLETAKQEIEKGNWTTDALVDISTVKRFLLTPEIQQAYWAARHGKAAYRNSFEIITQRKRASFANAMWVIDGTPCHLYYRDGKNAYARLNVFVVLDAFSWCVLGFYVSDSENHEQVIGALRAACMLSGKLPHQIQSDNGSAVSGYFGRTCIQTISNYFTPATPGNARSKTVESFFKHFNSKVGRFYPGFTHSPVMGKNINSLPNPEALQRQLKENQIQGKHDAVAALHQMFAVWNRMPMKNTGNAPLDKYKQSLEVSANMQRELTEQIFVEAFLHMPGELKQIRGTNADGEATTVQKFVPQLYEYTNDGIEVTLNKQKYNFITDLTGFNKKYIGQKFAVRVDRENPDKVYLYRATPEGTVPFIFNDKPAVLPAAHQFAQALVDRQPGEAKQLADHLAAKKLQKAQAEQTAQQFIELTKVEGTYLKLTHGNAFPKEILNAAKAAISEKIVNGEAHRLTDEHTTAETQQPVGDRWDNAQVVETPEPVLIPKNNDDEYDSWR